MDPINKIFVPPELNRYKLNTEFGEDYHSHITPAADSTVTVTKWKMVKLIGQGAFGVVFLEKERKGALRAVKMIYKKDIKNLREMLVLTKLKAHPQYFVQFFGWFENQSNIYLVMEYVGNGDLKNLIEGGDIVEDNAKDITKQLLKGLGIMHEKKICHRDLKPQNILISSLSPMRVKISDFGFSKQFSDDTALVSKLGTRSYLAPELWDYRTPDPSGYTTAVDIWSLGCLVYAIVTGAPPDLREFHDYVEDRIRFPKEKLIECDASPAAIEFISELLRPQPAVRLTAELALEHPWLNVEDDDDDDDDGDAEGPPRAAARNADHRFAAPEFWGNFVVRRAEREPRPSKTFSRLLRGIATHLLKFQKTTDKKAILPETMVHFYTQYRFEGERTDWKALFGRRSDACLSSIYRDLSCEHFNMSHACVPSLTSNGFETWMFTRLMAYPDSESKRIQQVLSTCPIIDINSGLQFPGPIPWQSFPETYDQAIRDRLQKAWRDWPQDLEELIC